VEQLGALIPKRARDAGRPLRLDGGSFHWRLRLREQLHDGLHAVPRPVYRSRRTYSHPHADAFTYSHAEPNAHPYCDPNSVTDADRHANPVAYPDTLTDTHFYANAHTEYGNKKQWVVSFAAGLVAHLVTSHG
jgi:hypothetical protein